MRLRECTDRSGQSLLAFAARRFIACRGSRIFIGLAAVQISAFHSPYGGRLAVESFQGKGCTFRGREVTLKRGRL